MILYPEVQKKVQQELDDVLAGEEPRTSDRSRYSQYFLMFLLVLKPKWTYFRLVYTDATLAEIQRHANLVPGALAHRATSDINIKGV